MDKEVITAVLIEKEEVAKLTFPAEEVLFDKDKIADRTKKMKRAEILGNLERSKCKITFEDDEGMKRIETTIWGVGDKNIILKKGMIIPVHRIHEIRIF